MYITNHKNIEDLLLDNLDNDVAHHVFEWRSGQGFATDCQIYRPNKFSHNHFENYKEGVKTLWNGKFFTTEAVLAWLIKKDEKIKYNVIPYARTNFGVWHTHNNEEAWNFLQNKKEI